ncbi:branched-chain amino acid ABC transporter ATP-binding protein/permease [Ideonella livida]|uniref:Branched-chain amino acid ABC transporter ATP-binding protein/permease n=1 Tax=Ideonella livida TaxID=2707176 RepID=A0A7C9TPC5_9BURK|nr:branched-chain amino acid ABC transporter ATP-binding protein/permease [Ideonella livida]NDY93686.1 branched-chain amino acid ABC transporter ATP-binding protein/permease [Ideonella livida]
MNTLTVGAAQPAALSWQRLRPWLLPAAVLLMLLATPWLPAYPLSLLNRIGLAALATLGLVLLTGVAGMTSFGQAAFIGLGAYAGAWLTVGADLPAWLAPLAGSPWLALPAGLLLTAGVAAALGALTLRLSGHYLPLGTLCWALALFSLFGTLEALGAHTGLANLPAPALGGWALDRPERMAWLIWGALLAAGGLSWQLLDSRTGRALRALNGGQAMAESMGVPVFRMKLAVFILSALLAALSGWLYAFEQRFVSPAPFSLGAGIDLLFMALIGGVGQLWGALAGAAVVTLARDWLQDTLPHLLGQTGNYEAIVFAGLVIVLMVKAPHGLWGWLRHRWPLPARRHGHLPAPQALPARPLPERGRRVLEVRGLTRRFGGLVANQDIDLDLHAGEILAVIGPNGAGKSTLFNQLSCVDTPTAGTVRFLGQDVRGWAPRRLAAAGLSRTFQHVKLLPAMSALDNVALGAHLRGRAGLLRSALHLERSEESSLLAEARHQLERVGLAHLADQPAGSLALGQQRLLEIARALCTDPAVLLLDEPAAGLRHQEKQALAALLADLRTQGMAVLLVEHDMDFVMGLADRVACIVFGRKVADGQPAAVQADPQVQAAYLGAEI